MHLDHEEYILDLVDHVNSLTNEKFDVRGLKPIGNPAFKNEVLDTSSKYFLPGVTPEYDAVLMVSQKAYPDSIERAVNNSREARHILSDRSSAVVLTPINDGRFIGLSYAVWPEHRPVSRFRLIRKFQKRWLEPKIFSWLHEAAKDSVVRNLDEESVDQYIRSPLECVAANTRLSDKLRSIATHALQILDSRQWNPVTILQHSDFWLGNVLLLKNRARSTDNKFGFCIIDWGGALIDGVPVFDMIRFCISFRIPLPRVRRELLKYVDTIQLSPEELIYYLVVALGRVGLNLEQFPENRYLEMCESNFSYLQTVGIEV